MKKCKSCCKEIDPEVKICPYCRDYQKWYYSPDTYFMTFFIMCVYAIFMFVIYREKNYEDYKDSFLSEFVNKVDDDGRDILTYRITNNSTVKWYHISFQLIGYDENGKVIFIVSDSEYSWIISPNQSKILSVKIRENIPVKKWQFEITDMRYARF